MIYRAINHAVLSRVPATSRRLLDLGCGSGTLGQAIKASHACEVVGVTFSATEAAAAAAHLDQVLVRDLNQFDADEVGRFDCVVCSHVLEHLYQPERLLQQLHRCVNSDGTLIVALPNILFWRQRLEFFRGRFGYTDGGLMDRTHYRFFDWQTAQSLLVASGYAVELAQAEGAFPGARFLHAFGRRLDRFALGRWPGLFGFQFIFVCRPCSGAASSPG
jgi:methionine biosynthesis protein MetW